jgi:membrane protein
MHARDRDRAPAVPQAARDAPGPSSPADLSVRGWRDSVGRTLKEIRDDRVTMAAASVAFYWFLAVFPLLFAAIAIMSAANADDDVVDGVTRSIETALPGGAATVLTEAVRASQTRASSLGGIAAILAIGVAIWSASSGMVATQRALDVAYDVEEERSFVKSRLVALALLGAAMVLGGIAVALVVFGDPIGRWIGERWGVGAVLWDVVRWIAALATMTAFLAITYAIGPNRRPPSWRWLSPGGIIATLVWAAASFGFSIYVSRFGGSYGETYGALAGVVILLLWQYFSALAIVVGAELNGELERQRAMRGPRPAGAAA